MSKQGLSFRYKPIEFDSIDSLITVTKENKPESLNPFSDRVENNFNEEIIFLNRLNQGYSLNIEKNLSILSLESETNTTLIDFWEYIQKCEKFKEEKATSKDLLDPSLGFITILKGNSSEEPLPKTIKILNNEIYENKERLHILKMCGWSSIEFYNRDEKSMLNKIINELLTKNQHFRAAAIAIFHYSFDKALEIFNLIINNKSSKIEKYANEIHYLRGILSGFFSVQEIILRDYELINFFFDVNYLNNFKFDDTNDFTTDFSTVKNDDITMNYLSEISKIKNKKQKIEMLKNVMIFLQNLAKKAEFQHPYLQMIIQFFSQEMFKNPKNFLYNQKISFFDRFGLLIRFFPPAEINSFLNSVGESLSEGIIEHIILFGNKFEVSWQILSSYLDKTRDIQTVGLASCHLRYLLFMNENKLNEWFRLYKEILTQMKLYEIRSNLDKDSNELKKVIGEKEKSFKGNILTNEDMDKSLISQKCFYCNCSLSHITNIGSQRKGYSILSRSDKPRIMNCLECLKPLPSCAICLLPITIQNPYLDNMSRKKNNSDENPDLDILNIDEALVWCQTCRHGGHYKHMVEWFMEYNECPVSDCNCECSML